MLFTYPCCKQTTIIAVDVLELYRQGSDQELLDGAPLI